MKTCPSCYKSNLRDAPLRDSLWSRLIAKLGFQEVQCQDCGHRFRRSKKANPPSTPSHVAPPGSITTESSRAESFQDLKDRIRQAEHRYGLAPTEVEAEKEIAEDRTVREANVAAEVSLAVPVVAEPLQGSESILDGADDQTEPDPIGDRKDDGEVTSEQSPADDPPTSLSPSLTPPQLESDVETDLPTAESKTVDAADGSETAEALADQRERGDLRNYDRLSILFPEERRKKDRNRTR